MGEGCSLYICAGVFSCLLQGGDGDCFQLSSVLSFSIFSWQLGSWFRLILERASILFFQSSICSIFLSFWRNSSSRFSRSLSWRYSLAFILFLTALLMRVLVPAPSMSSILRLRKQAFWVAGEARGSGLMMWSSAMVEQQPNLWKCFLLVGSKYCYPWGISTMQEGIFLFLKAVSGKQPCWQQGLARQQLDWLRSPNINFIYCHWLHKEQTGRHQ